MKSSILCTFFAFVSVISLVRCQDNKDELKLLTFDGGKGTTSQYWKLTNDPVMGGSSYSSWDVDSKLETAQWIGKVNIVKSLKKPGFCVVMSNVEKWNDASSYTHLHIRARSTIPYNGLKISFGTNKFDLQFKCFKADFFMLGHGDWEDIYIPFTDFSNKWSDFTGEPIVKCSEDKSVCPSPENLKEILQFGFWMEGVEGEFHFEVESLSAATM
mmetsp:Transcript_11553/g.11569  ORF Transcript_11553/g.11569 Transcript_11553/m.11569 type:complete len:214 (+) Transcript_11553:129-770(+)